MSLRIAVVAKCYNHPHRSASQRCTRCGTHHCDECLLRVVEQMLCPRCRQEKADAERIKEESRVPLAERLRQLAVQLAVVLAILSVLAGVGWLVGPQLFSRPLTEEEFNRIRDAYAMQMGDVNWAAARKGGQVAQESGAQPGYGVSNLIDEKVGQDFAGWRSLGPSYPQEIVIALPNRRSVRQVRVMPQSDAPLDSWARDVEVLRSEGPNGPWESLGRIELPNDDRFSFPVFNVSPSAEAQDPFGLPATQYVKVIVHDNWGNPSFCSLGEVQTSGT